MNESALKKTKRELLFNSNVGIERKKLVKEYLEGIIRITNQILGPEGLEFISKNEDQINYFNYLYIPGRVSVRMFKEDFHSYECFDIVEDLKIPRVLSELNDIYSCHFNFGKIKVDIDQEDLNWILNKRQQLIDNSEKINSLWEEIETVFYKITESDLKKFPEAYNLYIKFRTEQKDEKQQNKK